MSGEGLAASEGSRSLSKGGLHIERGLIVSNGNKRLDIGDGIARESGFPFAHLYVEYLDI